MSYDFIKKIRKDKDLTQSELATLLGVSRNVIAQIEIGKNKPTIELLEKLSNEFNIPLDNLITGDIKPSKRKVIKVYASDSLSIEDLLFLKDFEESLEDVLNLLLTLCAVLKKNGYIFSDKELKELKYYESVKELVKKLIFGDEVFNDEIKKQLMNIKNNSLSWLSRDYVYKLQKEYNFYVTEVEELENPPNFPDTNE